MLLEIGAAHHGAARAARPATICTKKVITFRAVCQVLWVVAFCADIAPRKREVAPAARARLSAGHVKAIVAESVEVAVRVRLTIAASQRAIVALIGCFFGASKMAADAANQLLRRFSPPTTILAEAAVGM